MTLKKLSQLYYLKNEIKMHQDRITEIRAKLEKPTSPIISDMPKGGGAEKNQLEAGMEEIIRQEMLIEKLKRRCEKEQLRLQQYINKIPDSLTRQIFTFRFAEGLTWFQVSQRCGGSNTEDGVKKICYRYLHK